MTFTKTDRVWWDTSKPGSATTYLSDASPEAGTPTPDDDSGIEGWEKGELIVCARSGFVIPKSEAVPDPYTGRLIWKFFVDPLHPADKGKTWGR